MKTVVENPRKLTHEQSYERETLHRMKRYEEVRDAVRAESIQEGMRMMGFTDKEYFKQFRRAFYVANLAHRDQLDKGGMPYIFHPVTVALYVRDHQPASKKRDQAMVAALLHDVLEDSLLTEEALKSFSFKNKIIRAVKLLTHASSDSYDTYIEKLTVSRMAMTIKCADMTDNENLDRVKSPATRDIQRSAFYHSHRLLIENQIRLKKQRKEKSVPGTI